MANIEIEELTKGQDSLRDSWPCKQPLNETVNRSHWGTNCCPLFLQEFWKRMIFFPVSCFWWSPTWPGGGGWAAVTCGTFSQHQVINSRCRTLTWGVTSLRSHVGQLYVATDWDHAYLTSVNVMEVVLWLPSLQPSRESVQNEKIWYSHLATQTWMSLL